jgi:hypothetical protein
MIWSDARHPLFVGAVAGLARRHGLDVSSEVDDEGDYTDRIIIRFGEASVTLIVPPPPAGWTLDTWLASAESADLVDPTSPTYDPDQYGTPDAGGEMVPPVHGRGDRSTPHSPNRAVQGSNISSRPEVGSHVVVALAPSVDQGAGTGKPGALESVGVDAGGPVESDPPAPHYTCPDHIATQGYEPCCACGGWTDDDPDRGRLCTEATDG